MTNKVPDSNAKRALNMMKLEIANEIGYNYNEILKLLYPGLELSYESYF